MYNRAIFPQLVKMLLIYKHLNVFKTGVLPQWSFKNRI